MTQSVRAALSCALAIGLLLPQDAAGAVSATARHSSPLTVHTAKFGATAVATASGVGGAPYLFSLSVDHVNPNRPHYFWVRNVGSLAVDSANLTLTVSGLPKGTTVQLISCSVDWNQLLGSCPGVSNTVLNVAATQTQLAGLGLSPGQALSVRAQLTTDKKNVAVSAELSVAVSR